MGITTELKNLKKDLQTVQQEHADQEKKAVGTKFNFWKGGALLSNHGEEVESLFGETVVTLRINEPTELQKEYGDNADTTFLQDKEK